MKLTQLSLSQKRKVTIHVIGLIVVILCGVFFIQRDVGSDNLYFSAQTIFDDSDYMLQYPSVYNGILWVTASCFEQNATVYKYDANNLSLLAKTNLTNGEAECFTAQEYKGLIYIPAISNSGNQSDPNPYGSVTVLNATTLKQVAFINASSKRVAALLEAVIDKDRGNMYFGADPHNGKLGFFSVPLSDTLDVSAYEFVTIAPDPDNRNSESQVVVWNGSVYVLACSGNVDGTIEGIVRTRLYHSSDLVDWVLDWEVTGENTDDKGVGGYFSHITASSDYLICGYLRDTVGVTDYRFGYIGENSTAWTEIHTSLLDPLHVRESGAEDHPIVNAISSDMFIWETNARQTSNALIPHQISVFNITSKTLTPLLTAGNGYNDRSLGIDENNSKIYVANCYDYSKGLLLPRSQILQINWNSPIEIPYYLSAD